MIFHRVRVGFFMTHFPEYSVAFCGLSKLMLVCGDFRLGSSIKFSKVSKRLQPAEALQVASCYNVSDEQLDSLIARPFSSNFSAWLNDFDTLLLQDERT